MSRVSRSGHAALVLVRLVFLKVKVNFHFYKKLVINKGASVIFELVRLNIDRKAYQEMQDC